MDIIEFNEPEKYTPNMESVPNAWHDQSFKTLDFTGKQALKELLVGYLENFNYDGRDSLIAFPSDFAYSIIVSIYIEVSKRVTVDSYLFISWNEYIARMQGTSYGKGDDVLMDALFGKQFVFLFDVTLSDDYRIERFIRVLDYCYLNKVRMLVATRTNALKIPEVIKAEYTGMYNSKLLALEIS